MIEIRDLGEDEGFELTGIGCVEVDFGSKGCILQDAEVYRSVDGRVRVNGYTRRNRNVDIMLSHEAAEAIANGAEEIDMVINVGALKGGEEDLVRRDIEAVVKASHPKAHVKVIIEAALLTDEEKVRACLLSKMAGADFVKTSTGFGPGGATVDDIALMRKTVGPDMGVKASGGIRSTEAAKAMVAAGASRIGASASVAIIGAK